MYGCHNMLMNKIVHREVRDRPAASHTKTPGRLRVHITVGEHIIWRASGLTLEPLSGPVS